MAKRGVRERISNAFSVPFWIFVDLHHPLKEELDKGLHKLWTLAKHSRFLLDQCDDEFECLVSGRCGRSRKQKEARKEEEREMERRKEEDEKDIFFKVVVVDDGKKELKEFVARLAEELRARLGHLDEEPNRANRFFLDLVNEESDELFSLGSARNLDNNHDDDDDDDDEDDDDDDDDLMT